MIASAPATGQYSDSVRSGTTSASSALTSMKHVPAEYFSTAGIPIQRGTISPDWDTSASHAIISGTLARQLWPGEDPIGRVAHAATGAYRVAGVASGIRMARFTHGVPDYQMYLPPQPADIGTTLLVRTMAPRDMMQTLIALARSIDATRVIVRAGAVEELYERDLAPPRLAATVAAAIALMGLTIAMVGLHGLLSYSVRQRRPEIAIRIALGAAPAHLARLVLGEAVGPLVLGSASGALMVALLTVALSESSADSRLAAALVSGAAGLVLLCAAGALVPAYRAAVASGGMRLFVD